MVDAATAVCETTDCSNDDNSVNFVQTAQLWEL